MSSSSPPKAPPPNSKKAKLSFENKGFVARTSTHFLPKFDNQNEDKRLAALLSGSAVDGAGKDRGILYVSKKHSGCLVMAPPFYSKNATANSFSRVGCVLLFEYFKAVWPGEGEKKFVQWWEHAERTGICYSFECVTPRILGDHGATPISAYMVLTCAAMTGEERFLSPAELLEIGTLWRLPLNEVWLIQGSQANKVEQELHANRWTMQDSDASKILDKYMDGRSPQRFLSHLDTQGEILEGFVLMALDADLNEMTSLVETYNSTMAPYRESALQCARQLGDKFLDPVSGKAFLAEVEKLNVEPLNNPDIYHEPTRLKGDISNSEIWDVVCNQTDEGRLRQLFVRLKTLYSHSANLQPYLYKGNLQVQIHIRDDEVFYGWPLHTMNKSTGSLFRGMVVTLYDKTDGVATIQDPGFNKSGTVKIVGIAKLKCLNYMWRTFGVRNRLGILFNRGKDDYIRTLNRGFYPPWKIPQAHRKRLDWFFSRWADFALSHTSKERDKIKAGYLNYVEKFLKDCPYPLSGEGASGGNSSSSDPVGARMVQVLLVNKSGKPRVSKEQLTTLGLDPESHRVLSDVVGRNGMYNVTVKRPKPGSLGSTNVVIVLAPDEEEVNKLPDPQQKAIRGAYNGFKKQHLNQLKKSLPNAVFCTNPKTAKEWSEMLKAKEAQSSSSSSSDTPALTSQSTNSKPKRLVLCTLALPPGGGKSTVFEAFKTKIDTLPNVSYCYRSSDDYKGRKPFETEFVKCVDGTSQSTKFHGTKGKTDKSSDLIVVGYDKNIPDMAGLHRLMGLLSSHTLNKKYDLRIVAVVPESLDHDLFWNRVKLRDPTKHIGLAIGDKLSEREAYKIFRTFFFNSCEEFLPLANKAPFAVVSDVFVQDKGESSATNPLMGIATEIVDQLSDFAQVGSSFGDVSDWSDEFGGLAAGGSGLGNESAPGGSRKSAPETANWCCADIEGHAKLHVTLVPPPRNREDSKDKTRKENLGKLQQVAGRSVKVFANKYHVATMNEDGDGKSGGDKKKGGRKRFNSRDMESTKVKRIAFWEVDRVEGLPDGLDLGEQMEILHITDRASITKGVKAKNAGDVLRELRSSSGSSSKWTVATENHPLEVAAKISFYK